MATNGFFDSLLQQIAQQEADYISKMSSTIYQDAIRTASRHITSSALRNIAEIAESHILDQITSPISHLTESIYESQMYSLASMSKDAVKSLQPAIANAALSQFNLGEIISANFSLVSEAFPHVWIKQFTVDYPLADVHNLLRGIEESRIEVLKTAANQITEVWRTQLAALEATWRILRYPEGPHEDVRVALSSDSSPAERDASLTRIARFVCRQWQPRGKVLQALCIEAEARGERFALVKEQKILAALYLAVYEVNKKKPLELSEWDTAILTRRLKNRAITLAEEKERPRNRQMLSFEEAVRQTPEIESTGEQGNPANLWLEQELFYAIHQQIPPREQELFDYLQQGYTLQEAAALMRISYNTVKVHHHNLHIRVKYLLENDCLLRPGWKRRKSD